MRVSFSHIILAVACSAYLFLAPVTGNAAPGELDPTYGTNGKATFFAASTIQDAAVQIDGKIVAAQNEYVVRYRLDGSVDDTFGQSGRASLPGGFFSYAIAIQPNREIIVAGWRMANGLGSFAATRLHYDGSVDAGFGNAGVASIRFLPTSFDQARDVALQPDGKIVLAGNVDNDQWLAVARFNADGSPDISFGAQGRVRPGMGPSAEWAEAVIIQPDLKIIAAGPVAEGLSPNFNFSFGLLRVKPDGQLDETFGNGGKVISEIGGEDFPMSLVLQADGKIVAGGYSLDGLNTFILYSSLARYDQNGSLDPAFASGGTFRQRIFHSSQIQSMVIQPDGKLVVTGGVTGTSGNPSDFIVGRFSANGSPDPSFGQQAFVTTDLGGDETANAILLQPDGKVVACGSSSGGAARARYFTAPTTAPVLQTVSNGAIALDSVTMVAGPFPLTTEHNFSADRRTRLMLFATSLTLSSGDTVSSVMVEARDAFGGTHTLPVEYVGAVPGFEWLTQVVVRLPDQLNHAGPVQVTVRFHGETSNEGLITIE